eukprot:905503-Amphidinium_carterae.1
MEAPWWGGAAVATDCPDRFPGALSPSVATPLLPLPFASTCMPQGWKGHWQPNIPSYRILIQI